MSTSKEPPLYQLHWQNPACLSQTEFVAQGGFWDAGDMLAWVRRVLERREAELPAGWVPMVCTQASEHFVLARIPGGD